MARQARVSRKCTKQQRTKSRKPRLTKPSHSSRPSSTSLRDDQTHIIPDWLSPRSKRLPPPITAANSSSTFLITVPSSFSEEQLWKHISEVCRYGKEYGFIQGREQHVRRAYLGKPVDPPSKSPLKSGGPRQHLSNVYTKNAASKSTSSPVSHTTIQRPLTLFVFSADDHSRKISPLTHTPDIIQNKIRQEFRSIMNYYIRRHSESFKDQPIRVDTKLYK